MYIVRKNNAVSHHNAETCQVFEYPAGDAEINGAVTNLKGRYPVQGRAVNEACKEMAYVINGEGKIVVNDEEMKVAHGDVLVVEAGERYYWQGELTLFISCTPAWYPEQHKQID